MLTAKFFKSLEGAIGVVVVGRPLNAFAGSAGPDEDCPGVST